MQGEKREAPNGQLISVNRKDTSRLLEVYIKRSLSLNDGVPKYNGAEGGEKWVMMEKHPRTCRPSSDPAILLSPGIRDGDFGEFFASESPTNEPEKDMGTTENVSKKNKKPSLWKSFLGLFLRKGSEAKEGKQEDSPQITDDVFPSQDLSETPSTLRKIKRSYSKHHRSLRKSLKRSVRKDIRGVEGIVSVEPNYSYYEKVSEEMEKIVLEVKENEKALTDEEVINRIIALTKKEGDAIDNKLKENPTLSNFFQSMSYACFQKLADTYLEAETTPTTDKQLAVLPAAPELVKLAFTLDFTARVAGVSRQSLGHITGLGDRYLQDRFEYKQACTDHPWSSLNSLVDILDHGSLCPPPSGQ